MLVLFTSDLVNFQAFLVPEWGEGVEDVSDMAGLGRLLSLDFVDDVTLLATIADPGGFGGFPGAFPGVRFLRVRRGARWNLQDPRPEHEYLHPNVLHGFPFGNSHVRSGELARVSRSRLAGRDFRFRRPGGNRPSPHHDGKSKTVPMPPRFTNPRAVPRSLTWRSSFRRRNRRFRAGGAHPAAGRLNLNALSERFFKLVRSKVRSFVFRYDAMGDSRDILRMICLQSHDMTKDSPHMFSKGGCFCLVVYNLMQTINRDWD